MGAFVATAPVAVAAAAAEVAEDLEEVAWLAETSAGRLAAARRASFASGHAFRPRTLSVYCAQARSAEAALAACAAEARASASSRDGVPLEQLEVDRAALADLVRMQVSVAAALAVAADWQSPPFGRSSVPGAGRYEGEVDEHRDDYKRDRHADAAGLEGRFAAEFAGAPGVRALLTSCGMSAFTTILACLEHEDLAPGRVVMGRSLYHECGALLRSSRLGRRVVEVDENEPGRVIAAVEDGGALFIDSLCNARGLALCDLRRILQGAARRDATIVIDNTCLSAACRPFKLLPADARCRLIVFESLTKYAQFGLDRTAAGLILARPPEAESLDGYREHLGSNITDTAACILPAPNRRRLLRRLRRMERNATTIARRIEGAVRSRDGMITGVVYPGLSSHPSRRAARGLGFGGGLLALDLRDRYDGPGIHGALVDEMLAEARRAGVPLVAGASFGLDTTRIYRTAVASEWGPFLRIAPGIEHAAAAEEMGRVLAAACTRF